MRKLFVTSLSSIAVAASAWLPVMAQTTQSPSQTPPAKSQGAKSQASKSEQPLTDAQIAHIVVTANQVDMDAGKLAEKKASNPDVKQYGKQMATDHAAVNKQANDLVKKLKVKPQANETSTTLKKGGTENVAKLNKLSGKEFDKAYVTHEVAYHQAVIDTVDKSLLPAAKNADLKALLEKVRPTLEQHLDQAKQLESKLGQ